MIRIPQAPSVANFPQPPARDRWRGVMRLGMILAYPANSLFRQMNSLFGPKISLISFEQGIRLQAVDSSLNLSADRTPKPAKTGQNLTNSLLISLFSGKVRPSPVGAHSRVRSPRVPASLKHVSIISARRFGKIACHDGREYPITAGDFAHVTPSFDKGSGGWTAWATRPPVLRMQCNISAGACCPPYSRGSIQSDRNTLLLPRRRASSGA
jgi:hypothetical protein